MREKSSRPDKRRDGICLSGSARTLFNARAAVLAGTDAQVSMHMPRCFPDGCAGAGRSSRLYEQGRQDQRNRAQQLDKHVK